MIWLRGVRSRMVGGRGVRCGMVGSRGVRGSMMGGGGVRGSMVGVLLLGWGEVGVLVGVLVQLVQGHCLTAINLVPKLARELVLVEQSSIGAHHAGPRRSVPPVVAHAVHLASSFRVGVHAGLGGGVGAAELGVGRLRVAGVILARHAGHTVLVVVRVFVVRLRLVVGGSRGVVGSGLVVGRGRLVVGWCGLVVDRGTVGGGLVIVSGRLMVSRSR